jgi:hypothetical protein
VVAVVVVLAKQEQTGITPLAATAVMGLHPLSMELQLFAEAEAVGLKIQILAQELQVQVVQAVEDEVVIHQ